MELLQIAPASPPPDTAAASSEAKVALVTMPWGSVRKPALAMALLKNCVVNAGFAVDLHHFNIHFAERLGLHLYESIVDKGSFVPEWFFAQALFGPAGLAEIDNGWSEICSNPTSRSFAAEVAAMAGGSEEICKNIANEHVPRFIDDCMERVDWSSYSVIGFTTTFAQSLSSLLLARRIKEKYPRVKVILGGANVDGEMGVEFMRGFEWIDCVVHGEAEKSLPALLRNLVSGRSGVKVPGVTIRNSAGVVPGHQDPKPLINMNEADVPDYSDYMRELGRSGFDKKFDLRLWFESSRGCWWGAKHHCTFCGLNATEMSYRKKEPERVFSELKHLSEKYHCLSFCATDSILSLDYFNSLLPKLSDMDADLHFFYEIKANLNREQIRKLAAAGIREIQPGIESFNSRILQMMRKGITAIQNIQLLKWCYEDGITPSYNILYGFPGETPEDYANFPELCRTLAHLIPPDHIGPVIFERFSPYHYEKEFGLKLKPLEMYRFVFPSGRVSLDKIAYCFEGDWEGKNCNAAEYTEKAIEAVRTWQAVWNQHPCFCYYAKGSNYLVIYDSRPWDSGSAHRRHQYVLNEPVSSLYLFCDENRSFQAIWAMMAKQFGSDVSAEQVQSWLDWLVQRALMFREGERYLALAVHKTPAPHGRSLRPGQFELQ